MSFNILKIERSILDSLYKVKIVSITPFSLMIAPVYIYSIQKNSLDLVKKPFDFFTLEELDLFKKFEVFYFSFFVKQALPFQKAGIRIRQLIDPRRRVQKKDSQLETPYELSQFILNQMGPLWTDLGDGHPQIEPFLVFVFINSLLGPFPSEKIINVKEKDIENFEKAITLSSLCVFFALHLGYYHFGFLEKLRLSTFETIVQSSDKLELLLEGNLIFKICSEIFTPLSFKAFQADTLLNHSERVALKLNARLDVVKKKIITRRQSVPSIFGPLGFADAGS